MKRGSSPILLYSVYIQVLSGASGFCVLDLFWQQKCQIAHQVLTKIKKKTNVLRMFYFAQWLLIENAAVSLFFSQSQSALLSAHNNDWLMKGWFYNHDLHNDCLYSPLFCPFFFPSEKSGMQHWRSHQCLQANTQLTTVSIQCQHTAAAHEQFDQTDAQKVTEVGEFCLEFLIVCTFFHCSPSIFRNVCFIM